MKIALAFDIERTGATDKYDTIAIGASVLDENFKELDSLLLLGYFPEETKFDPLCWDEFWVKHPEILKTLKYKGTLNYEECQKDMITKFQEFRTKWEAVCSVQNHELVLVSDNCFYDGGFINNMIFKYLPDRMPIPYAASGEQDYMPFQETGSIFRGILKVVDPTYDKERGHKYHIRKLFWLPKKTKPHDHNPENDAYGIAYNWQVSNAIGTGKIKRKAIKVSDDTK